MKPVRHAVSVAVRHPANDTILIVRRPPDDADLPDAWGLPAASLDAAALEAVAEAHADAVRRAGREKLGVDLEVGRALRSGAVDRAAYRLIMTLFEATIRAGQTPAVPQPFPNVTQYAAWGWAAADALVPAAERGSLCCRLFLEHAGGQEWVE